MKNMFKAFLNYTIKPFFQFYLSKERTYNYKNIYVKIFPGVFHPGFFFSTKILLSVLEKENLKNKTFLELGAGSGLISVYASKQGAIVTATDISEQSLKNIAINVQLNNAAIKQFNSDLFDSIPAQTFDYVIINPPYYQGKSVTEAEFAWYAGEQLEYFQKLFKQLGAYLHSTSNCMMILNDECDIATIRNYCEYSFLKMDLILSKKKYWETNYVFRIAK